VGCFLLIVQALERSQNGARFNERMRAKHPPESLAMDLAWFLTDRLMLIETKTPSHMKNTAKTTSPAFFKPHLQINDLQSSLMIREHPTTNIEQPTSNPSCASPLDVRC
jgi:hypothetical protein